MQMLKRALIAYVNSIKAVWSKVAHPLDIVSKRKGNVKDYRIYGNSIQDGTPTPENPIEVQSVGELTTKNIFNIDEGLNQCLVKNEDGTYTLRRTANDRFSGYISLNIPANTEIAFGVDVIEVKRAGNYKGFRAIPTQIFYADGTHETITSYDNKTYPSTTGNHHIRSFSKDIVKIRLFLQGDEEIGDYITFKNMQIEIGAERTDYEPYQKYKVPVTVRGKNLFNYEDSSNHTQGYLRQDNSYISDPKWRITNYIPVSGKNVCLSGIQSGSNPSVCAYDADKNFITGLKYYSKKNVVIKSDIEISFVRFSYSTSDSIVWDLSLVQLEKGATATEYEPYIEPQAINIYLDKPLKTGEVIQQSKNNLPKLPQFKGTTIYEVQTAVPPSGMQVCYYE